MTTVVRDNERSHAIDLISQINDIASKYNLQIKKAGGERTISTRNDVKQSRVKVMFPDVVLYGDVEKTKILQGWELKLPDTLITDETFIKDAQRKAEVLGLNSCFIWNFTSGVLYIKNDDGNFEIAKEWTNTNHIRTRDDVNKYRDDWEKEIDSIVLDINQYLIDGFISGTLLGEVISDTVVAMLVSRNKELVANELKLYAISNTVADSYLEQWWKEVENEFSKDEVNKYHAYAKILILNWSNRIVFAHLIKKYHNDARKISSIIVGTTPEEANQVFNEITTACDYYSIFSEIPLNACIPHDTWNDLLELNFFLEENGIEKIEQTSLQRILEYTVSTAKRELAGQFTTPPKLAEILTKITLTNLNGNIIDPCCGTGSIPKAALVYKKEKLGIDAAVNTTWASDKYEYPLQVANISLTSPETINIPNKVFKHNVLSLYKCKKINITNPTNGELMDIDIPLFDCVLSNLPFIPFEIIKEDDLELINKIVFDVKDVTGIGLNNKSDMYCYIIFALHKILAKNGRVGLITSNSWLGTVWGKDFYKALNYYFDINQIHISKNDRWFHNAQVVTVILVLTKKSSITKPIKTSATLFCSWKKSLTDICLDDTISTDIINSSLLKQNLNSSSISFNNYSYETIENILKLNLSLNALFHDVEWINEIKSVLTPIKNVFTVIRGERRGWDDMFYPENNHRIEKEFIKQVLKNARGVSTLIATADNDAFCCNKSIDELKSKKMSGAISWINKFEIVKNGVGKPLPEVLARKNMYWYEMKDTSTCDIFTMMNPDKRLFFAKFDVPTFINQRLIGLKQKELNSDINLNHALLNSIVGMFYIEAVGFGRGLGALDINKASIGRAFMLDSKKVSPANRERILEKFEPLLKREIKTTREELTSEDRAIFDKEVLHAFGIENYYDKIKHSLLSMQESRLSVK